ncbi:MAG: hypothetical protein RL346_963 [Verrucomicrobiota bacterium]
MRIQGCMLTSMGESIHPERRKSPVEALSAKRAEEGLGLGTHKRHPSALKDQTMIDLKSDAPEAQKTAR